MEEYKDKENLILMFTDAYDVIFNGNSEAILEAFHSFKANIIFGAEHFCWPRSDLAEEYPKVIIVYPECCKRDVIGSL